MRTENSKDIVMLGLLWMSTKTRSSVSFRKGHVNKLGLINKESPEKRKLRIVMDMRHERAAVPERPILPRPRDNVADWEELFSEAASLGFTTNSCVSCGNVTCDLSDAYTVMFWCTRKNSRIVWSRLRVSFLVSFKTLHSCVVRVLIRKVHHSRGAISRLLLEMLRRQC